MKTLALAENVSAAAVAAQTALTGANFTKTPFLANRSVVATIKTSGVTGSPVIKVQGSTDGSTYVDLLTLTGAGSKEGNVQVYPYMRTNVTTAGTAGTFSSYLQAE